MANESFSFSLKSHPHLLLIDHLQGVASLVEQLWSNKQLNWHNESEQQLLFNLTRLIAWCHDLGKATSDFQSYIMAADSGQQKKTQLSQHQALSALLAYWAAQHIFTQAVPYPYFQFLPLFGYLWVKRHHGNLRDLFDDQSGDDELKPVDSNIISRQIERIVQPEFEAILGFIGAQLSIELNWLNFQSTWQNIADAIYPVGKKLYRQLRAQPDQRLYFIFQWCYSLLLTADKYQAMLGCLPEQSDGNVINLAKLERFRQQKFKSRTDATAQLREAVYQDCLANSMSVPLDHHFFALNVPTGSGKTLAGLAAALILRQRLIQAGHPKTRIIYCLPFMSIIDQNFKVFSDVFESPASNILLKHHSLVELAYREPSGQEYDADRAALLIEGWDADIVVTTFVQLFHTAVGNQNMMVRRMHQLTGSIIILDEIQTLPYQFWPLVERLFEQMANLLDCRFILMTATLPRLISEQKLIHLVPDADRYFDQFDRYQVCAHLEPITIDGLVEHVERLTAAQLKPSMLIIVNTTTVARLLYQKISDRFQSEFHTYHLSTRLTPNQRLTRIEKIKQDENPKIVVSTQLVEAGVDFDFDIVIRDFSPLDSINQAAGRCNREGNHARGIVEIVVLVNDSGRPYYRYIYGKEDILKIFSTREIIDLTSELTERQFLSLIRRYYASLKEKQGGDLADDLLAKMGRLAFHKLSEFQLISEDYPSASIFISEDQQAEEIWQQFIQIHAMKASFEKRRQFLKLKPQLMQYVISVPKNLIKDDLQIINGFYYLPANDLERLYHQDVGFYPTEETQMATLIF